MNKQKPNRIPNKRYPYPRNQFVRSMLKGGIGFFTRLLTRFEVIGRGYVPESGPLIVVANHFHFLDAVILILSTPWPLEFLSDFQMPNVPLALKIFPALYKTFDVAQGRANLESLRASEAILAQDGVLGIFPEGRVHPPPMKPALPGAAFLALRTGVPLLPMGIYSDNEWDIFGTIRTKQRKIQVTCRFGQVFGPLESENPRRPSRAAIDAAGDRIISEIAKLLPSEMRGNYPQDKST